MYLLIFKTSVATPLQVSRLKPLLTAQQHIKEHNFDLQDCDNILRIVSTQLKPEVICDLMATAGFSCEEMECFDYDLR